MRIAPGPSGDGRIFAAIASPPREPGVRNNLDPRVDDNTVVSCRLRLPRPRVFREPPRPGVPRVCELS